MKKVLLLFIFSSFLAFAIGQDTTTHSVTAYIYQDTLLWISANYNENCPESGTGLQGRPEVGFHSGANMWSAIVTADSTAALTARNDSSDRFRLLINPKEYYGVEMANLTSVFFLFNDFAAMPDSQWNHSMRDSVNSPDGGFGEGPCSDMRIWMDEVEPMPKTSLSVLGCKDTTNGLVQVSFDYGQNCPEAGKALSLEDQLGFHSGANDWSVIVAWDSASAVPLTNNGLDTFSVIIRPEAYYGIALDSLENIVFVANNGINSPSAPWDNAGRGDAVNPAEDCADLVLFIDELPGCSLSAATGIDDKLLNLNILIAPNPFTQSTKVSFANLGNETMDIEVINMNGQIVQSFPQFRGNEFEIQRKGLPTGLYFLSIRNSEGKFATEKLMIN